jgi:hypothetical protein
MFDSKRMVASYLVTLHSPPLSYISFIFNRMCKYPSAKSRVFKPLCNLRGEGYPVIGRPMLATSQ